MLIWARVDRFLHWLYPQQTLLVSTVVCSLFLAGLPSYHVLYYMCVTFGLLVHLMSERCKELDRIHRAVDAALDSTGIPSAWDVPPSHVSPLSHALGPVALNDPDAQEGVQRLCFEIIGKDVLDIIYAREVHDAAVEGEHHGEGGVHDEVLLDAHGMAGP